MLYEPSFGQKLHAVAIGSTIERDGQVELGGVDPNRRASDRYTFCIAGKLELGSRRPEIFERQVSVAQDVDLAVLDPSVHPAGHLKNLVRPQVRPCQHVLAALHHVRIARIVDHDRVQPADVEGGLACGSHSEQEGAFDQTVKKRSNDANRLATVVEGGGEVVPAVAELFGNLLDFRTRRDEHGNSTALAHDTLYETIVQELEGLLRQNADLCGLRGIKRPGLQDLRGSEIILVEARIHRGRQPDEAAARALP